MINQQTLKTFDKLYADTYEHVSKYVICHCHNIEDAKDIIQNIYYEVLKNITRISGESYIMGIAKNKVKDYYRFNYKNKIVTLFSSYKELDMTDNIPTDIDLEKTVSTKYDAEIVWDYLKHKNIKVAQIFYLFYYLELPIKDIASELNISESNVKNYLYRTLKELKVILEKEDE